MANVPRLLEFVVLGYYEMKQHLACVDMEPSSLIIMDTVKKFFGDYDTADHWRREHCVSIFRSTKQCSDPLVIYIEYFLRRLLRARCLGATISERDAIDIWVFGLDLIPFERLMRAYKIDPASLPGNLSEVFAHTKRYYKNISQINPTFAFFPWQFDGAFLAFKT